MPGSRVPCMVDTARDYRILVAEYALGVLEQRLRQWGMPWPLNKSKALGEVAEARRALLRAKYSFLPARDLAGSPEVRLVAEKARSIASMVIPEILPRLKGARRLAFAEIRWALSILIGLPQRILLGEENHPEYAVDVVGVEVTRVEPLEGTENLRVTRASAGKAAFTIVTNIRGIRVGEVRAAAILPPVEFSGVVSEAMYASEPIGAEYVGKRVPRRLLSPELRAQVIRLVSRR